MTFLKFNITIEPWGQQIYNCTSKMRIYKTHNDASKIYTEHSVTKLELLDRQRRLLSSDLLLRSNHFRVADGTAPDTAEVVQALMYLLCNLTHRAMWLLQWRLGVWSRATWSKDWYWLSAHKNIKGSHLNWEFLKSCSDWNLRRWFVSLLDFFISSWKREM